MRHKVLIYGSRHWKSPDAILHLMLSLPRDTIVVTGGAPGADVQADALAKQLGFDRIIFPYNGNRGVAGGPVRNQLMLDCLDINEGIGFRGPGKSNGTDDMTNRLRKAGIDYRIVMEEL